MYTRQTITSAWPWLFLGAIALSGCARLNATSEKTGKDSDAASRSFTLPDGDVDGAPGPLDVGPRAPVATPSRADSGFVVDGADVERDGAPSSPSDGGPPPQSDGGLQPQSDGAFPTRPEEDAATPPLADGGSPDGTPPTETDAGSDAPVVAGCIDDVCDFWPPCGCREGLKCAVAPGVGRYCLPAGTDVHGETCEYVDQCAAGYTCAGFADEEAYCLQYCEQPSHCDSLGPGSRCEIWLGEGATATQVCSISCDLASTAPVCPRGTHCDALEIPGSDESYTHCTGTAGTGTAGASCSSDRGRADCAPGHFCGALSFTGEVCIRLCRLPDGFECAASERCNAFGDPIVVGDNSYGYCY
jgi:hypothetical protein